MPYLTVTWAFLAALLRNSGDKTLPLVSAGVAFFSMLAIFPGLAAVVALWGLVADPYVVQQEMELTRQFLPGDVFDLLQTQVSGLVTAPSTTLGWASLLSLLLALWSARSGVGALITGLNTIHGVRNRTGLRHYVVALTLTLALIGVALVALATVVVAPILLAFLPLGELTSILFELIRWCAAVGVVSGALIVVYRFGPNRAAPSPLPLLSPGVLLVTVMWAAASAGFSIYLANFGNYNQIYGSIGAVIALLMWLYISAFLVLLGALVDAQLEERIAQLRTYRKKDEAPQPAAMAMAKDKSP
ncbi:YihY/virulence factor BrkB family protein [Actibacterium ureilyticum]|uniref:YihY/virulence factor BrkB family protein n=1 Tax=Actibacterium ureilyticum TaxID=1590614 RepID=UPI001FE4F24D|nr:YihY/virulence factor BrkB family protein [Actibacterium ureilyticum]